MIVTNAGNYPRIGDPAESQALRRALAQRDDGRIDEAGLRKVQDDTVHQVIDEQVDAGLDLVTDGLIRWDDAITYIVGGLQGFADTQGLVRYLDTNTFYRQPVGGGAVRWAQPITVADYQFAASVSPRPVKAVLTGPYTIGRLSRSSHHKNANELVLELSEALRAEVQALHAAGAPLVQIDEPVIARQPGDWAVFREAMTRLAEGVTGQIELNTSWGNLTELPDLFGLPFHVFGVDLIQGPANWELLDRIPSDKTAHLGILDAREVRLEGTSEIAHAIERASRVISLDRMHVSPNCGLEFLPRATARAKLQRLADGAKLLARVGG